MQFSRGASWAELFHDFMMCFPYPPSDEPAINLLENMWYQAGSTPHGITCSNFKGFCTSHRGGAGLSTFPWQVIFCSNLNCLCSTAYSVPTCLVVKQSSPMIPARCKHIALLGYRCDCSTTLHRFGEVSLAQL